MFRATTAALMALVALAALAQNHTPPARINVQWDTNRPAVRAAGLSPAEIARFRGADVAEQASLFRVSVEPANPLAAIDLPAIAGRFELSGDTIEFRPAYAFEPGLSYRATVTLNAKPVTSVLRIPRPSVERSTVVTAIYPSADRLPQNLLKFYLHFSAPMSGGHIYDHIHLTEEDGTIVELPFLEIDEELWNPEMNRLTLFLDPGRIKREVRPLEEIGPALYPGKKYTLTISETWPDARGALLKERFVKTFSVTPPDRDPPDPASWRVEPPRAHTRGPLRITFSDPMDHALALRMISVRDVRGRATLGPGELTWSLEPDAPWKPGDHEILVQTTIEDLAGNNIGKPFEVDLQEGNRPREPAKIVRLPFRAR